jgi:predicted DNA-binding transcriptional regulator AlpA
MTEVHQPAAASTPDRVIYRADLPGLFGVSSETVRRWIKAGRLPKPDIAITQRTVGWRLSTLQAAGIGIV